MLFVNQSSSGYHVYILHKRPLLSTSRTSYACTVYLVVYIYMFIQANAHVLCCVICLFTCQYQCLIISHVATEYFV